MFWNFQYQRNCVLLGHFKMSNDHLSIDDLVFKLMSAPFL